MLLWTICFRWNQIRVKNLDYPISQFLHSTGLLVAIATASLVSTLHHGSSQPLKLDFLVLDQVMEYSSDAPLSQTTPTATTEPIAQAVSTATPTNAEVPLLPPKGKGKVCNNRKKYIASDHFEKVDISEGHFKAICNYCQKTYPANSKGHGTANLLNHTPICVKNPNKDTLKGQQTLAFEPKMDGKEGFQLVPTDFIVEASRKALAEMVIIDELPFRFVESLNDATIKFLQNVTKDWEGTILEHEFLHMRCCVHILNLIVRDGMRESEASIAKVREAVRYMKSSPNRNQTFMGFMERLGIESKSLLCLDVPTRWNSTFLILETAQKFEKVFIRMDFEDDSYSSYFMNKESSCDMGSPSVADVMVELVRGFFVKLYDYYSCVDSPNVQVPSGSERTHIEAFSTRGRILDPFRSSLSPLVVQNLVCAQDWLQALVPISFRKSKDEVKALEDEFHDLVIHQAAAGGGSSSSSKGISISVDD
ncbi:hypothetical protein SO802_026731 [Lithocarpus litseifolius]|uniref:BED-type domain-containing protein n=1 Tax=Lithocarpus litseifolius TaxID=425828 RepID=A0AAW2C0N3_9ROSI